MNDHNTPLLLRVPSWVWWCVIVVVVGIIGWRAAAQPDADPAGSPAGQMQARYLVGLKAIGQPTPRFQTEQALDELAAAGPAGAMSAAAIAGELHGLDAARARLEQTAGSSDDEKRVHVLLTALWSEKTSDGVAERAAALAEPDRRVIVDLLGWSGRLALAPEGADPEERAAVIADARTTAWSLFGAAGAGGLVGCVGVLLLVIGNVLALTRRLQLRLVVRDDMSRALLAMFALWFVLFPALSAAATLVLPEDLRYIGALAAACVSLVVALRVPGWCGVPWHEARQALGWTRGSGVVAELGAGVLAYIAMLPWLVSGLIVALGLGRIVDQITGSPAGTALRGAAHPAAAEMANGSPARIAQVLVFAVVVAPLAEETLFRGALFGHLRSATARWPRALSFLLAAVVSGLVFAAVHPQGIVGVPILCGIATGFAVAREWRGSLIASMTAHAISNTVAMTLTLLAT